MENKNMGNPNDAYNPNEDWRKTENNDEQLRTSGSEHKELRDAQVQGFGTDPGERAYLAANPNPDDSNRNNDDEDEDENEDDTTDWGNVDPLDTPGDLPDPMDPSGPGSAV
jgi:hypothetical protein